MLSVKSIYFFKAIVKHKNYNSAEDIPLCYSSKRKQIVSGFGQTQQHMF